MGEEQRFITIKVCGCPERCYCCPQCENKPKKRNKKELSLEQTNSGIVKEIFAGFLCEYCGKHLKHKGSLDRHMKEQHKEQKYKCHYCEYETPRKENLKSHERRKHGVLFCSICLKSIQFNLV